MKAFDSLEFDVQTLNFRVWGSESEAQRDSESEVQTSLWVLNAPFTQPNSASWFWKTHLGYENIFIINSWIVFFVWPPLWKEKCRLVIRISDSEWDFERLTETEFWFFIDFKTSILSVIPYCRQVICNSCRHWRPIFFMVVWTSNCSELQNLKFSLLSTLLHAPKKSPSAVVLTESFETLRGTSQKSSKGNLIWCTISKFKTWTTGSSRQWSISKVEQLGQM